MRDLGRVIAVVGRKATGAKKTTAINIAAALTAVNKKILLIDSDPQGNSTRSMGIDSDQLPVSAYDLYTGASRLSEIIRSTGIPQLDVVPAKLNLAGIEIELISRRSREQVLKNAIRSLRRWYDCILIDCPPSLGLLTVNALTAADGVIIHFLHEYNASEELSALANLIRLVKQDLNPALIIDGMLLIRQ